LRAADPPAVPVPGNDEAERPWWWVFDPRHSLRAFAATSAAVALAVFTALTAESASRSLRRSLEAQAGAGFETLAAQMSDKLDRTLFERYRTLQFASSLATLRSYSATAEERRRVLASLQSATPDFVWLGVLDAKGMIVACTKGYAEGSSAADRPWFIAARETAYAAGPREVRNLPADVITPDEGDVNPRVFDLAVPLTDPDGRFGGVLAAHLRWGWTREVQLSVVPDLLRRDRIGVTLYSGQGDVLLDSGGSGWNRPPDAPAGNDTRRLRGFFTEGTTLGTTYLTGYARSRGHKDFRGLGWITAVRQPTDRAFATAENLRRTILQWGLVFTAAATVVAWLIAGRIARRLRTVERAAGRIASGDVLATLPPPRGDSEIDRMCAALGRLIEELRARPPGA
jgi:HAMP domain-containing protein